ncbi:MAG: aldehyde dehydrogenase family protein [Cyclobacteriaceae bacterium]|nr:aldehyde dehydrogenase family protein [Cyclobacteriaceae bacterium]
MDIKKILIDLKVAEHNAGTSSGTTCFDGPDVIKSFSPVDGSLIGSISVTTAEQYDKIVTKANEAFHLWRMRPAPQRGEVVRQIGEALRAKKQQLGTLVSYEMGKSLAEGLGEVQEMIDICDFAVGLSRQLYGLTMHSERPRHRMYEQYHPLGTVGIITAFNFPVAVWAWNSMIAWVCGDTCVWKPSEKAPLCGIACQNIIQQVFTQNEVPEGVSCLINGNHEVGEFLTRDNRIALISATGSIRMGKIVAATVAARLGKSLLELGGNNAIIITEKADIDLAVRGAMFGAIGTCGQRCTSTRRLIIHERIFDRVKNLLISSYKQIKIGNPLNPESHMGPLIDLQAVSLYNAAIEQIKQQGGTILTEHGILTGEGFDSGCYVKPVIAEVENTYDIVQEETFAPILYLIKFKTLEQAISLQNGVKQGLSSAIMTTDLREMETFLSQEGSDCGIANVNIGTSGAEIGGAFGGEKETGGGRESGSDAWKIYMRRQTNTINYGTEIPLAQGIKFVLD